MVRDRDELQELALKYNNQMIKSIKLQDKLEVRSKTYGISEYLYKRSAIGYQYGGKPSHY